jgi:hypothetical protein
MIIIDLKMFSLKSEIFYQISLDTTMYIYTNEMHLFHLCKYLNMIDVYQLNRLRKLWDK